MTLIYQINHKNHKFQRRLLGILTLCFITFMIPSNYNPLWVTVTTHPGAFQVPGRIRLEQAVQYNYRLCKAILDSTPNE